MATPALRGASAEAYAGLAEELSSVLSGGADAAAVADGLFAFAGLLRSEPALRRTATDMSLAGPAKTALVEGILAGKVDDGARRIAGSSVARRWTASRDLADTLEHLSVVATVRSTGDEAGRLADELFAVAQLVKANPDLRDALADPARSTADKGGLVESLLSGKVLGATQVLVTRALAGTYRTVGVALAEFQKVAAEVHGERVATVHVATALSDADRQRLQDALSRSYGRQVHLNVVVEPALLGGLRVEIGDDVIDGTVVARLDAARRQLAG